MGLEMSNVFSFTGTVGRDAEVKYLPSGQALLTVTVANNIGFGDKQQTMWVRCSVWGKRAEGKLSEFLKKGQQVFVSGELSTNEYNAKDGTAKTALELNCNVIDLVGGQRQQAEQEQYQPAQRQQPQQKTSVNKVRDNFDDDIPF